MSSQSPGVSHGTGGWCPELAEVIWPLSETQLFSSQTSRKLLFFRGHFTFMCLIHFIQVKSPLFIDVFIEVTLKVVSVISS